MNTTIKFINSRLVPALLLPVLLVFSGCDGRADDQAIAAANRNTNHSTSSAPNHSSYGDTPAETPVTGDIVLAGMTLTPPAAWQSLGADGMRKAQFRMSPVSGDKAEGEVNVFYFGPQSGGGVEANLQRWIGQISLPDGGDSAAAAERSTFEANGMAGHVVSLNGTYKSGGGRPMGGGGEMLPGYRLVGVVVEGPQGSLFFKLTGPVATVAAMEEDLLGMVQGAR